MRGKEKTIVDNVLFVQYLRCLRFPMKQQTTNNRDLEKKIKETRKDLLAIMILRLLFLFVWCLECRFACLAHAWGHAHCPIRI